MGKKGDSTKSTNNKIQLKKKNYSWHIKNKHLNYMCHSGVKKYLKDNVATFPPFNMNFHILHIISTFLHIFYITLLLNTE